MAYIERFMRSIQKPLNIMPKQINSSISEISGEVEIIFTDKPYCTENWNQTVVRNASYTYSLELQRNKQCQL